MIIYRDKNNNLTNQNQKNWQTQGLLYYNNAPI